MAADFECDRTYIQYTFRTYMQCIECTVQYIYSFAFIVDISYSCRKTGWNCVRSVSMQWIPLT
jgi:hypothetical protein